MTLLTTVLAAVIATVIWHKAPKSKIKTGSLCLIYWGASLMWLVDAVFAYAEQGADFFAPALADMIDDFCLGLFAVALGLVIWLAMVWKGRTA